MKADDVAVGILFICIGIFVWIAPDMGLLPPGQILDQRLAPIAFIIGIVFLISGLASKNEKIIAQPVQPQQPQHVVKTLVICPKCGSHVPAESKFCPECGTSLTSESYQS